MRDSVWPLRSVYNLDAFKIDALGLVTLLGGPEVNNYVGKLVRSRYLEFLPLLGAYIIASDEFTAKQPGFQLYNLEAKIYTPDIAGWFARWLMTQDFRTASSYVQWEVESVPRSTTSDYIIGLVIGVVLNGGFLAVAVLMGDWWGFTNAMSMAISTIARVILLNRNRTWLDRAVEDKVSQMIPKPLKPVKSSEWVINQEEIRRLDKNKLIVILPDARAVALRIPGCLLPDCFVFNPKPPNSSDETKSARTFPVKSPKDREANQKHGLPQLRFYHGVRMIAWAAFGAHVISIGMSRLVSQIITVVIIVLPTVLITYGFGCDQTHIGSRLRAVISELPHCTDEEKRADMYAFLDLTEEQDNSLHQWSLTPHRSNVAWWDNYKARKMAYHGDGSKPEKPLIQMNTMEERKAALSLRVDTPEDPPPNSRHVSHGQA